MTQLKQHQRFRRQLLNKIAVRSRAGECELGRSLLEREKRRYLGSHQVQSAALYDIWNDELGSDEALNRWSLAQRKPILPHDYRRFRAPPVVWYNFPRQTTGHRKICRLPSAEKLWHVLARDLIVAQHEPRQHIGDWRARGRDWQTGRLRSAINSPFQGVVSADIRCAFATVNAQAIYDLHYLPEPLIRRAIDYRTHRFVSRQRSEHTPSPEHTSSLVGSMLRNLEMAPTGLMEGSPASNAVFSVLMDDLPDHLGEDIEAFVYCDNIILLAPTMLLARRAHNSLVRYLAGHRAGPFEVRSIVHPVTQAFEHLGYSIWFDGTRARVALSPKNWLRYGGRLEDPSQAPAEALQWLRSSFSRLTEPDFTAIAQGAFQEAAYRAAHQTAFEISFPS